MNSHNLWERTLLQPITVHLGATAITQIITVYLNYKFREIANTLQSVWVGLCNGSSSLCNRNASFWLDTEVVNVNFCLMGLSMYVDIRFSILNDVLRVKLLYYHKQIACYYQLDPIQTQTDRRLHLLSSSWCIQVTLRRTTEWSQTWSLSLKQSFQMQRDYKSIVSLVLNIQSAHNGSLGSRVVPIPGMKKWLCFVKSTLCPLWHTKL